MQVRQLSPEGAAFIQQWEGGPYLTGYLPTPDDVPTAGWGHTGPDVRVGDTYTLEQCQQWFTEGTQWACAAVENDILPILAQHQFDALVSLCFNIGAAGFGVSHVARYLNQQPPDIADAADSFLLWDKQHGTVLQGLLNRRRAERALFLTP